MNMQPFMHESTSSLNSAKMSLGSRNKSATTQKSSSDFFDKFRQASKKLNEERTSKQLAAKKAAKSHESRESSNSSKPTENREAAKQEQTSATQEQAAPEKPAEKRTVENEKELNQVELAELEEAAGFAPVPQDGMGTIQLNKPQIPQDQAVFNQELTEETKPFIRKGVENVAIENLNPPKKIDKQETLNQLKQQIVKELNLEDRLKEQGKTFPPQLPGDKMAEEKSALAMSKIAEDAFFQKETQNDEFKAFNQESGKKEKISLQDKKMAGFHFASRAEINEGVELEVKNSASKETTKIEGLLTKGGKEDLEQPRIEQGADQRKFQSEMMAASKGMEEALKTELKDPAQKVTHHSDRLDTQEIVGKVRLMMNSKKNEMIMQLKPEHLGKMEFRLVKQGDQMTAHIAVGSHSARELLESQMAQLHKGFENQGIQLQNVNIDVKENLGNGTAFAFNEGQQQQQQNNSKGNNSRTGNPVQTGVGAVTNIDDSLSPADGVSVYA